MAEEDDYMSDIFLQDQTSQVSGMGITKANMRKRKMERNKQDANVQSKTKARHVVEHERRQEGLSTSLSQDNLGFKLMEKMGYKKGQGLGKEGEGRSEPVPITLKSNRTGLGKEASDKAKLDMRKKLLQVVAEKKLKLENIQRQDFRSRMSQKFVLQQTDRDLNKSQKACFQLDADNNLEEPLYTFFWPEYVNATEDADETESEYSEFSAYDKLTLLTNYLRQEYFYCIWCASKYDGFKDMLNNCPGDTASAHDDD